MAICTITLTSFAGCKKTSKTNETSTVNQTTAGMKGWKAFTNKVTITIPVYDRSQQGAAPVDNNYWTQWIQKNFGDKWNIDVKYVAIPRGDVMTKYNLLITAGQSPTVLMEYDYPKVSQWANDGALQEINLKDFAQVAPTYNQIMVNNKSLDYSKLNGKTYFVLSDRPYSDVGYSFQTFVRKDWLDKVGMAVPKTYTEYTKAIDAIKAAGLSKYPIALSLPSNPSVGNGAFRDFPINEKDWAMYAGIGEASLTWGPTQKALLRQNAEYNKGYYNPEFDLDVDGSQAKTDFINGKTYAFGGYLSSKMDWLNAFYEKNPGAQLAIQNGDAFNDPSSTVGHTVLGSGYPFGMIVGFSAKATKDQLKAAWMYMEWMAQKDTLFTLENGVQGKTYTLDKSGLPIVDTKYTGEEKLGYNMNIDYTCIVHASKVLPTVEDSIKVAVPQGIPQDFYDQVLAGYNSAKELQKKGYIYTDPLFSVQLKSESEYSNSLFKLWQQDYVKLVKCKPAEFNSLYTDLCKKYLSSGYQEILDEKLKAYKDGKTTKLPSNVKK